MNKAELINLVKATRSEWDELLAQVNDSLMLKTGVEGDWSAKDILAHVMWYERQMVQLLRSRDLIGSNLWELPVDDRNAQIHKEITGLSLQSVRRQSEEVFAELLQQLAALPDDAYGDSSQFQNMPTEWEPWYVIAENTFRHYLEHSESVRRLLEAESS